MVSQFKISLQINRNMEEYKYLNGVKVGDEHYFKNLEDVIESIWGKKEQGKKPVLRIFDHYDFNKKKAPQLRGAFTLSIKKSRHCW